MMSLKSRFFFCVMVFVGAQSECMEQQLKFTPDILSSVIMPYLSLQSIARFGRTCKTYQHIFEPGKIQHHALGLTEVEINYHRCTQALGRFAQYENKKMFTDMWMFDAPIRYNNVAFLGKELHPSLRDNMNVYRKHYSTLQDIEKNIAGQLRIAIINRWNKVIDKIVRSKKYNIFELFNDEAPEAEFRFLCSTKGCYIEAKNVLALLPVEDGEQKNRAVQYLAKYDELSILITALKNGYLEAHKEYGNQCTLLHYAAVRGCRALTDELLKKGADVHVVNAWGRQPFEYVCMFEKEHRNFGHTYLYRGPGVVTALEDWCYKRHCKNPGTRTQKCFAPRQPWNISKEEADWLRNSCTYSLEEFNLL